MVNFSMFDFFTFVMAVLIFIGSGLVIMGLCTFAVNMYFSAKERFVERLIEKGKNSGKRE